MNCIKEIIHRVYIFFLEYILGHLNYLKILGLRFLNTIPSLN